MPTTTDPSHQAFMHACGQLWDATRGLGTRYAIELNEPTATCALAPTWNNLPHLHQLRWAVQMSPVLMGLHNAMHTTLGDNHG